MLVKNALLRSSNLGNVTTSSCLGKLKTIFRCWLLLHTSQWHALVFNIEQQTAGKLTCRHLQEIIASLFQHCASSFCGVSARCNEWKLDLQNLSLYLLHLLFTITHHTVKTALCSISTDVIPDRRMPAVQRNYTSVKLIMFFSSQY